MNGAYSPSVSSMAPVLALVDEPEVEGSNGGTGECMCVFVQQEREESVIKECCNCTLCAILTGCGSCASASR